MSAQQLMTPDQMRAKRAEIRRKRVQGTLSGIGALTAATSAGLVATGKIKRLPKLTDAGYVVGTGSAGLGAIGGANFARNQFKEASEQKAAMSQTKMDNTHRLKKSLSTIAKARKSVAVPQDSEAWRAAGRRDDDRWRNHVSEGALRAYDEPLAPSRKRSRRAELVSRGSYGAAGAAMAAWPFTKGPAVVGAPAAAGGLVLLGRQQQRSSRRFDEASRKIRARGMQRMMDAESGAVGKAFGMPRVPGGFSRPSVARMPGGRFVLRRPYATPAGVRRPRA